MATHFMGYESIKTLGHPPYDSMTFKAGIRAKNNQLVKFSRIEPLPGTRWLHADAETIAPDSGDQQVADAVEVYGL